MTRKRVLISGALAGCAAAWGFWWMSPTQLGVRALEKFDDDAVRAHYADMVCRSVGASGGVTCTIPTSCGADFTFGLTNLAWFDGYWSDFDETRANLWAACPEMISDPAERARAKEACEGAGTAKGVVEINPRQQGECVGP